MPADPARLTRHVPSLAEHLGDGTRAEGFEEWVAMQLDQPTEAMPEDRALFFRIAQTFGVACVEQMRRETERDPSPEAIGQALAMWSRAAGFVTITALSSVAHESTPFRRLARIFAEEFKTGGKIAADALEGQGADHV